MRLVETLVVRDDADIVDTQIAYHLSAGVDFVIATDHRSRDGTTQILESYERAGVLRRIAEEGEFTRQGAWQTRMARLAVVEHGADWVINSDADEFWWPRGASLKDALGSVPRRYGVVRGLVRNFVPGRAAADGFPEGLTVRLATSAPINDPATPFRPVVKAAHRGDRAVVVGEGGSHQVYGVSGALLRDWYPLEVLHFPLRSEEQCARKYQKTWTGWAENLRADLARARQASDEGRQNPLWDRVALDDSDVERGLADGSLVADVRIRDAVRQLRGVSVASRAQGLSRPMLPPTRAELDAHALEVAVFEEADLIRHQRWADELEARVRRPRVAALGAPVGRSSATRAPGASSMAGRESASRFRDPLPRRPTGALSRAALVALAIVLILVALPEAFGDRPYDPRPTRVFSH